MQKHTKSQRERERESEVGEKDREKRKNGKEGGTQKDGREGEPSRRNRPYCTTRARSATKTVPTLFKFTVKRCLLRVRYRSDVLLSHSASRPSKYRSCEEPEVRSHPRTVPSAEHTESSSP